MSDLGSYKVDPPSRVPIEGRQLNLFPFSREKHLDGLWSTLGGAEGINQQLKYFPNDNFDTPEQFADWIESMNNSGQYVTYVAVKTATGEVAGMASYMRIDAKFGVIEVGSVAHGTVMRRSSLSTEMHYLMARHVFDDMKYRRYEWKCHSANQPSWVAAVRYGFTFEGVFRQHMISKGKNRDTAWFAIIDRDWPLVKQSFESWLAPENFDGDGNQIRKLEQIRKDLAESHDQGTI